MQNDATYAEKFELLKPWMKTILEMIKKELKKDHLKVDYAFYRKYFAGRALKKLTMDELVGAYSQEIGEGKEELGEYLSNCWLLKNTDLYDHFASHLDKINPQFDEIDKIELKDAQEMIAGAVEQFGAERSYIFSVLNSVVFPKECLQELEKQAMDGWT